MSAEIRNGKLLELSGVPGLSKRQRSRTPSSKHSQGKQNGDAGDVLNAGSVQRENGLPLTRTPTKNPATNGNLVLDTSKLKRKSTDQRSVSNNLPDSATKRRRTGSCEVALSSNGVQAAEPVDPIQHWATSGYWPKTYMMESQQSSSSRKRSRENSYSKSSREGQVPRAHSRAFEVHISQFGMIMSDQKGRIFVSAESKTLCEQLLLLRYDEPAYTLYPLASFLDVCDQVRVRNEARVFRDLTPLLVPSPELLFFGGETHLEHLAEELSVEWMKSDPLAGPRPRPDMAVGIGRSAFTDLELPKLHNFASWDHPTKFTDNLYFPFLLCECKCGDQSIDRADRQNMQSASLAVRAIIQLHIHSFGKEEASKLSRQILVFSISHDNVRASIYAHYGLFQASDITYHRYSVEEFKFSANDGHGRKQIYQFVRGLYDTFYPKHLERIRSALATMPEVEAASIASSDLEGSQPQNLGDDAVAAAAQDRDEENKRLRQEVEEMRALLRAQSGASQGQQNQQMAAPPTLQRRV